MRRYRARIAGVLLAVSTSVSAQTARFETSLGTIVVQLESTKAPDTVRTFLARAKAGFYDGTIFHRAVPGFVVNGGEYMQGEDRPGSEKLPVDGKLRFGDEANNGLRNLRGTLAAMRISARPGEHSPTGFFFNLKDNPVLDYRRFDEAGRMQSPQGEQAVPAGAMIPGFTVFGRVIGGMDVLERIGKGATTTERYPAQHWVIEPVVLKRIRIEG